MDPLALTPQQKFDALVLRYQDHVDLLRYMSGLDLRVVSALLAMQLVLGSWLASDPIDAPWSLAGVILLDAAVVFVGIVLLMRSMSRRADVVATLNNVNAALGFFRAGFYLHDRPINVSGEYQPWGTLYAWVVAFAFFGVIAVAVSARLAG